MTDPMDDLPTEHNLDGTTVLPRGFYQRPTTDVAMDLLGKIIVRRNREGVVAVRIYEVEAYLGAGDPACHTFGGRRSRRTETMWGPAGVAYVYLIYGIHSCLNVVTVAEGTPEAVLIRGAEPVAGRGLIRRRRGSKVPDSGLTDGPGKLCQALAVNRDDDGEDLCAQLGGLSIRQDDVVVPAASVVRSPRIGVDFAGEAAAWPLRFVAAKVQSRELDEGILDSSEIHVYIGAS
jgi:DNA-3-methyladenine glycosylase